jgi:hypothetical protein
MSQLCELSDGLDGALECLCMLPGPLPPAAVAAVLRRAWQEEDAPSVWSACKSVNAWRNAAASAQAAATLDELFLKWVEQQEQQQNQQHYHHQQQQEQQQQQQRWRCGYISMVKGLAASYALLRAAPSQAVAGVLLRLPVSGLQLALALRQVCGDRTAAGPVAESLIGAACAADRLAVAMLLLRVAWSNGTLGPTTCGRAVGALACRAAMLPDAQVRARFALGLLQLARDGTLPPGFTGRASAVAEERLQRRRLLPGAPVALPHAAAAELLRLVAEDNSTAAADVVAAFEFVTSTPGGGLSLSAIGTASLSAVVAAFAAQGKHEAAWQLVQQAGGSSSTGAAAGDGASSSLLAQLVAVWESLPTHCLPAPVLRAAADAVATAGSAPLAGRLLGLLAAAEGSSLAAAALSLSDAALMAHLLTQLDAGARSAAALGAAADLAEAIVEADRQLPQGTWARVLALCSGGSAAGARLALLAHDQLLSEAAAAIEAAERSSGSNESGAAAGQPLADALLAALASPLVSGESGCADGASAAAAAAAAEAEPQEQQQLTAGWAAAAQRADNLRAQLAALCAEAAEGSPGHWLRFPSGCGRQDEAAARRLAVLLCASSGLAGAAVQMYQEFRQAGGQPELEGGLLEAALAAAHDAGPELATGSAGGFASRHCHLSAGVVHPPVVTWRQQDPS